MPGVAGVEGCLAASACLVDSSFVDGVGRVVVQAAVAVVGVVVSEEGRHVFAGMLEVLESAGKVQVVFHCLERDSEYGLSSETRGRE